MSDNDVQRPQLAEHLRFFAQSSASTESSRDPAWRRRRCGRRRSNRPRGGRGLAGRACGGRRAASGETLELVREDLGDCTRCKLHRLGRTQIVFGVGNPQAELMFVGEAPGHDEDIQGIPFVGRAGQLLTKIIEAIDLTREDVYIANVIKCRPPENRNPEPDEVGSCEPFLFRQIQAIKPR